MPRVSLPKEELLAAYRRMFLIRNFELRLEDMFVRGLMPGTFHSSAGQEAVAVGVTSALDPEDVVVSNHRGHGHFLAKGAEVRRIAAELFGRSDGYCMGKGGTQHMSRPDMGFLGSNGITGGGIPVAAGAALACKMKGERRVAVAFFGDGAANQGTFHESLNMAAIYSLPVLYVCENNCYAMSMHVSRAVAVKDIAPRADGYGIERAICDGNDVEAVHAAAADALKRVRSGRPFLLECKTYRMRGHSKSDRAGYRPPGEAEAWAGKEPLRRAREALLARSVAEEEIKRAESEALEEIEEALKFAESSPPAPPKAAFDHVFAEAKEPEEPPRIATRALAYREALREALMEEMERDERVFLIGEDIGVYDGAFKVTRGLLERFGPERVVDTPISENSFVGIACGSALMGMRPVIELMFMDFLFLALDQLANHAAKYRYIYAGQVSVPMVLRTPAGGYRGYGATHSQSLEGILINIPGLKVVAPATPFDAKGMLTRALRMEDPVAFIEHKLLYSDEGPVPEGECLVPFGKARVVREGGDVTIISYSYGLKLALEAADKLAEKGVGAEVVDLRSLEPLDAETIVASAEKTQRAVVVEEGLGVGARVSDVLQREAFGMLDAPVLVVSQERCPIPAATHLERRILPGVGRILRAVERALRPE